MTTFSIAAIQLDASHSDNLEAMRKQIDTTVKRFPWVQMVIFGELCAMGPSLSSAQATNGPTEEFFCKLALQHDIWLVPGSLYEIADDKIYNTAPVISPKGEVVTRHRKLYPFLPYEQGVAAGNQHTVFDIPDVGRFGVSICYDKWFPETTRAMVCQGAEVILHPTLTNTIDRDFELSITRSSAGINQCYFVDVNNTGDLGYGRSTIIGPEGDVIYEAGSGGEIIPLILDLDRARRVRENGMLGLGQPLKSFRDGKIEYPQYKSVPSLKSLQSLGPLSLPTKTRNS
jgi:predicted amidohydrolase